MLFPLPTYPKHATTRGRVALSGVNGVPWDGGLTDPVARALWVYGHIAWLNTLTVKPGWLGSVYQGQ